MLRTLLRAAAIRPWVIVGLLVFGPGCDPVDDNLSAPTPELLAEHVELQGVPGAWVHVFEEETSSSERIYRPEAGRNDPEVPFRGAITFEADGGCSRRVQDPMDAHFFEECSWLLQTDDPLLIHVQDRVGDVAQVRVLESSAELLRLGNETGNLHVY